MATGMTPAGQYPASAITTACRAASRPVASGSTTCRNSSMPMRLPGPQVPVWVPPSLASATARTYRRVRTRLSQARTPSVLATRIFWSTSRNDPMTCWTRLS